MSLVYFDGFDAHISPRFTGLDVGAGSMQDAGLYWTGGTPQKYSFPTGFESVGSFGKEGNVFTTVNYATSRLGSWTACRVGFWAKSPGNTGPTDLVRIGHFSASTSYEFCRNLRINANGTLTINGDGQTYWTSAIPYWSPDTWKHFEFYAHKSGRVVLKVNGEQVIDIQTPEYSDKFPLTVHLYGLTTVGTYPRYDHMYITTGEELQGSGVYGVQVVAAVDNYLGKYSALQGTLITGGTRYLTNPKSAAVSTDYPYADGKNLANVINFMFPLDPSTAQPWTTTGFNNVSQWGLCFYHDSFLPKGEMRVAQAHLAVLRDFDERGPIVQAIPASSVTSYSGPWRKSNPSLTLSEHIRPLPRRNTVEVADTTSLFIGDEGCILFDAKTPIEPPLTTVGLTFAEEFREDYKDWVRIDGLGQAFESFFVSGYSVLGEGNRKFQDNYVTINYQNIPTGRAYIQGLWDYSTSANTGRWSMKQIIENKGGDYTHAHRRVKIRGHGKAVSFKITNYGERPFTINGWTILASSNQSP